MVGKRRFGRVRELPSGRWQARYKGPDGLDRPAPQTFDTKGSADRWLTLKEAEIIRGDWIDPDAGRIAFGQYATDWISERAGLRPRTIELYRYLLRQHLQPVFGACAVADIWDPDVRRWRKRLLDAGVSPITVAKSYRLLKSIMNTAMDDGLIRRNPCRIKGASTEKSPERPVLTVQQVFGVVEQVDSRYRALLLLAVFGSLRWGELAALRRCDIDLRSRSIKVVRQLTELHSGELLFGPPKSAAGKRTIAIPEVIMPAMRQHLVAHVQADSDALVFSSPGGKPLRHSNFYRRAWLPARKAAGIPPVHFHDLRHTGNQLTASAGAGLRELMDRMGHSSTRAALVYLHGSDARQQEIASALSKLTTEALRGSQGRPSGTQRARKRGTAS